MRYYRGLYRLLMVLSLSILMALPSPPALALSEAEAAKIGKEMYEQVTGSVGIYENERIQNYVRELGHELALNSDRPDIEYTFTVLDSPDINAFATPGGYVYVNRGLLAYLKTRAELAGVISHEIAHITEDHASRQQSAGTWSNVGSFILGAVVAVTTGSGAAASATQDVANTAGYALVRGYGRDMELEADREGAKFMARAGYNPEAMLSVLSVLKDQESFMRVRAKDEGRKPVAYHGVFSTHPRNDDRLQEVIAAAKKLDTSGTKGIDPAQFRDVLEGMKFSEEQRASAIVDNRYYNAKLGFTLAFPSGWRVVSRSGSVLGVASRDNTALQMRVKRADATVPPENFLRDQLKARKLELRDGEEITGDELQGYTGVFGDASAGNFTRIAVIYFGSNAYLFEGRTSSQTLAGFYDTLFRSSIDSFRPMEGADRDAVLGIDVHFVKAVEGTTFKGLATECPLPKYKEEQLRLVNGYYPRGEPEPGEWVKIFR